jgi:hypothetical protein
MRKAFSFMAIIAAVLALPLAAQSTKPISATTAAPLSPAERSGRESHRTWTGWKAFN